jgi:hypothetical protein
VNSTRSPADTAAIIANRGVCAERGETAGVPVRRSATWVTRPRVPGPLVFVPAISSDRAQSPGRRLSPPTGARPPPYPTGGHCGSRGYCARLPHRSRYGNMPRAMRLLDYPQRCLPVRTHRGSSGGRIANPGDYLMDWSVGQVRSPWDSHSSDSGSGFSILKTGKPVLTLGYSTTAEANDARDLIIRALENARFVVAPAH